MRATRILAACLVTASMLGAVAVAASAEGPEFQTQNKKTGAWEPLAKKVAFTETSGTVTFSSAGTELTCETSSGKGKLTGPKTFTVKTVYNGCRDNRDGVTCQSKKKSGVIKLGLQEGSLVAAGAEFGGATAAALSTPAIGAYKCGGATLVMTGSALGAVTPVNEPTETMRVGYSEGAEPEAGCGRQELQLVDDLGPCVHLSVQNAGSAEPVAMVTGKEKKYKGHVTLNK